MLFPAARIGDPVTHDTTTPSGTIAPPPEPPAFAGQVMIEGMPAAYVGCLVVCSGTTSTGMAHTPPGAGAPPVPIVLGSPTVLINGRPAARWATSGDFTGCTAQLGNASTASLRTVLIGGPTAPAGFAFAFDAQGNMRFGKSIWVVGDDLFKAKVANRLIRIASLPVGQRLLNSIENSGHGVTIQTTDKQNSFAGAVDTTAATALGKDTYDGEGKPIIDKSTGLIGKGTGKGSDAVVSLNPDFTLKNPKDPSDPVPNDAVLFHELQHANHDVYGTSDCAPNSHYDTNEEENTISNGDTTETTYLSERGYQWKRTDHSHTFVPMYEEEPSSIGTSDSLDTF